MEEKLRALGPPAPDEPPARGQMRDLLAHQRALSRQLADQLEQATDRKVRLLDLLKTLWLEVAHLRAQSAIPAEDEVSGKIRAVCEEIGLRAEAEQETHRLGGT